MALTRIYRVETDDLRGMYAFQIGIYYSPKNNDRIDPAQHRPQPKRHIREHLMDVGDKSQHLFGFRNIEQVQRWIRNPTDFEFLSQNFKLSVYEIDETEIVEDENQLVYFHPKAVLIERLPLNIAQ